MGSSLFLINADGSNWQKSQTIQTPSDVAKNIALLIQTQQPDIVIETEIGSQNIQTKTEKFLGNQYSVVAERFWHNNDRIAIWVKNAANSFEFVHKKNGQAITSFSKFGKYFSVTCKHSKEKWLIVAVHLPHKADREIAYDALETFIRNIHHTVHHVIIAGDFNMSPEDINAILCVPGSALGHFTPILDSNTLSTTNKGGIRDNVLISKDLLRREWKCHVLSRYNKLTHKPIIASQKKTQTKPRSISPGQKKVRSGAKKSRSVSPRPKKK